MAYKMVKLQGLDTVMANLTSEIKKIRTRGMAGLIKGAIIIRRDMDKTEPLIPVDTGNLRSSWYTRQYPGVNPGLEIGFTASYAIEVHESGAGQSRSGAVVVGGFKRKGAGPKFLEASVKRNTQQVLKAVREGVMIR